ncbi:MAG: cell wall hydrolase, partial [Sphingopyxis sp.]|nr:cell wall hydrolase [Sphingopyxis sp.]
MMRRRAGSTARRWGAAVALAAAVIGASPAIAAQAYSPEISVPDPDPRDLDCLASAISYEAGNEPVEGQEAVAKVVLNRLRAPEFPKTVCGVIFQGSTRRTGCQFTFTCDGSLLRPRSARSMAAARLVAERVLRGEGGAVIGDAINYHADYVSPVWARSLSRVTKIGAHIFYRRP